METRSRGIEDSRVMQEFLNETKKETLNRRDGFGYIADCSRDPESQSTTSALRIDSNRNHQRWAECSYNSDNQIVYDGLRVRNNDERPEDEEDTLIFVSGYKRNGQ